jgi:hypothetical protein
LLLPVKERANHTYSGISWDGLRDLRSQLAHVNPVR